MLSVLLPIIHMIEDCVEMLIRLLIGSLIKDEKQFNKL